MGRATKGSQRHMQDAVALRQQELRLAVGEALPDLAAATASWVSPLEAADYKEFFDGPFLDVLGLQSHRDALRSFWPRRGPQWDALSHVNDEGVLLVEAKAHLGETPRPDCSKATASSRAVISQRLSEVRTALRVPANASPWIDDHYQIANRIAHLWWLHEVRRVPAWLVFLGFTHSPDWPTDAFSEDSWRRQVAGAFRELGLPASHALVSRIGIAAMPAVPPFTNATLRERFMAFDNSFFGGRLANTTVVAVDPIAGREDIDGRTKTDGSIIYVNARSQHEWECTLLHEMSHAYVHQFAAQITPSGEARACATWAKKLELIHGPGHTAEFFSVLFDVMRRRGDDPAPKGSDFARYFG